MTEYICASCEKTIQDGELMTLKRGVIRHKACQDRIDERERHKERLADLASELSNLSSFDANAVLDQLAYDCPFAQIIDSE